MAAFKKAVSLGSAGILLLYGVSAGGEFLWFAFVLSPNSLRVYGVLQSSASQSASRGRGQLLCGPLPVLEETGIRESKCLETCTEIRQRNFTSKRSFFSLLKL